MEADGSFDLLPKKEVLELRKEKEQLNRFLGGIRNMTRLPDAVFIIDPRKSGSRSPRLASWESPSSPSSIPTATRMRSTWSSPATTMRSGRCAC